MFGVGPEGFEVWPVPGPRSGRLGLTLGWAKVEAASQSEIRRAEIVYLIVKGQCIRLGTGPSPRPSPIRWERENRWQRVCNGRFFDANDGRWQMAKRPAFVAGSEAEDEKEDEADG